MALTNLFQVIRQIQSQPSWQKQRQFMQVVELWPAAVGESVAMQSKPVGIFQNVLQVAVANSSWANALVFERRHILEKLNPHLTGMVLQDIHFSTAKWHQSDKPSLRLKNERSLSSVSSLIKSHPSYIPPEERCLLISPAVNPPQDAVEAFQRWAKIVKKNTANLPKCPRCKCPAPSGEIARWRMCRNCANVQLFK